MGCMFNAANFQIVPALVLLCILSPKQSVTGQSPPDFAAIRQAIESRKYKDAETRLTDGLKNIRSRKDTLAICNEFYRLAVWLQNDNRYREAARAAQNAYHLALRANSLYWASYSLLAESHMYWQLGEYAACAERLDRSLDLTSRDSVRTKIPHAYFSTLQRIGILQIDLGYPELALQKLHAAEVFFRAKNFYFDLAAIFINLASAHRVIGNLDSSEFYLRETLRITPLIPIQPNDRVHAAYVNLGLVAALRGQLDDAIGFLRRAISEKSRTDAELDESYVQLGDFYDQAHRSDEAASAYRKALQLNSDNYLAYCGLGRVLAASSDSTEARRYFDSAATLAAAAIHSNRGKAVIAALNDVSPVFSEYARFCVRQGDIQGAMQRLEQNRGLYSAMMIAIAETRNDRRRRWSDSLQTLHRRLQVSRMNANNPASVVREVMIESVQSTMLDSAYGRATPWSIFDVRRQLRRRYALIQFAVMPDSLLLLAVTPDTACGVVQAISKDTLSAWIDRVTEDEHSSIDEWHRLYQVLIEPVQSILPQNTALVLIPDGPLYRLSFDALVVRPAAAYRDCEFLIHGHSVSYAISISVFLDAIRKRSLVPRDYLGIAAGEFDTLSPLPGAHDQVSFGASLFRHASAQSDIHNGEVFRLLERARILDFATHALVSDADPMSSQIIFGRDVSIRTPEIYDMHLDADLVVLSGCRTGLGKLAAGEGFIGFNQAFSYAGAYSLLMSNRDLDDDATRDILKIFYEKLAEGHSRTLALREAKLEYLASAYELKTSPHFWAGLTLWGNPEPIHLSVPPYDLYFLAAAVLALLVVTLIRSGRRSF